VADWGQKSKNKVVIPEGGLVKTVLPNKRKGNEEKKRKKDKAQYEMVLSE
jgi:hypothetical protein